MVSISTSLQFTHSRNLNCMTVCRKTKCITCSEGAKGQCNAKDEMRSDVHLGNRMFIEGAIQIMIMILTATMHNRCIGQNICVRKKRTRRFIDNGVLEVQRDKQNKKIRKAVLLSRPETRGEYAKRAGGRHALYRKHIVILNGKRSKENTAQQYIFDVVAKMCCNAMLMRQLYFESRLLCAVPKGL